MSSPSTSPSLPAISVSETLLTDPLILSEAPAAEDGEEGVEQYLTISIWTTPKLSWSPVVKTLTTKQQKVTTQPQLPSG